jgi:ppGpp synthetase/RelA/SpoT-type nucleotidyltranferase
MSSNNIDHIVAVYQSKKPLYDDFVKALDLLLRQLLKANRINIVAIEGRAKDIESFKAKAMRDDKEYTDALGQITDLAGIRIVTNVLSDVDSVCKIIEESFDVDKENSIDKSKALDPDRFGYLSIHYVVKLSGNRYSLKEYADFKDLKAEIQIRTVLQHAWAAISHKLVYKSSNEVPRELRRKLYRVSALLEEADGSFDTLVSTITDLRLEYAKAVTGDKIELPLNIDSMAAYVDDNENACALLGYAKSLGIIIAPHPPVATRPEFSNLLAMMHELKIETIQALDERIVLFLGKYKTALVIFLSAFGNRVPPPPIVLVTTKDALIRWVVYLTLDPSQAESVRLRLSPSEIIRTSLEEAYSSRGTA